LLQATGETIMEMVSESEAYKNGTEVDKAHLRVAVEIYKVVTCKPFFADQLGISNDAL
jgi:hypothetical protein